MRPKLKIPSGGPGGAKRPTDLDITRRSLATAVGLGSTSVHVVVMLDRNVWNPGELVDHNSRVAAIAARKASFASEQNRLMALIEALGGKVTDRKWLTGNGIGAQVSAALLPKIAALSGVRYVKLTEDLGMSAASRPGQGDARPSTEMETQAFIDAGANGGGNANHVRVGILEVNGEIDASHVGLTTAAGASRIIAKWSCDSSGCSTLASVAGSHHGTNVTGVASGSITDGQDSNHPGSDTADQRQLSGHAPYSDIYFYRYDGTDDGMNNALAQAVTDELDVLNMSFGDAGGDCSATYGASSVRDSLAAARNAAIVLVGAAGNNAYHMTDSCDLSWPGEDPNVLDVNGLANPDRTFVYTDSNIAVNDNIPGQHAASIGGLAITSHGGTNSTATVIGVAAPVCGFVFGAGPNSYDTGCGTSYAAPAVAGAMADMRDMFVFFGGAWVTLTHYADAMAVNMLMLGDAWDGQNVLSAGGSVRTTNPTPLSGYGRVRMHFPSSGGITGPYSWHWQPVTVTQGNTSIVSVNGGSAVPSGVSEFKVAATWVPDDLSDVPDIDVYLYDTCGGAHNLVAYQNDYDYHNRIWIPGSVAAGKCLSLEFQGYSVPAGGVVVQMASLYDANTL